jgi:hypothetical protein
MWSGGRRENAVGVGEIDFDWLLKLRVTVGRCGEMDLARWWNTNGQLGTSGANVLGRGFPRTHLFAQARSVIVVAQHRCAQLFDLPGCATLWNLTEVIEDAFDSNWESWLDEAARWKPFFEAIARIQSSDLVTTLEQLDLVTREEVDALNQLKCLADGHAVQIPGLFDGQRGVVSLLALGFGIGAVGKPVIPYARRSDA